MAGNQLSPRNRQAIPIPILNEPEFDRFGLPNRWTLMTDSPARKVKLAALVLEVFQTAVHHLGEADAKALFKEASKGRPGAKKGARDKTRDAAWLKEYDARTIGLSPEALGKVRGEIARELYDKNPNAAASYDTAYRHLLALVKERDAVRREREATERRMRAFMRSVGCLMTD
jgi:hypothetical protein